MRCFLVQRLELRIADEEEGGRFVGSSVELALADMAYARYARIDKGTHFRELPNGWGFALPLQFRPDSEVRVLERDMAAHAGHFKREDQARLQERVADVDLVRSFRGGRICAP